MVKPGNFPARAAQIVQLVPACGGNDTDPELWVSAWERVRWASTPSPTPSHAELPVASGDFADHLQPVFDAISPAALPEVLDSSPGELATASDKLLSRLMGDMGQLMTELHAEPSMSDGGWGERVR